MWLSPGGGGGGLSFIGWGSGLFFISGGGGLFFISGGGGTFSFSPVGKPPAVSKAKSICALGVELEREFPTVFNGAKDLPPANHRVLTCSCKVQEVGPH